MNLWHNSLQPHECAALKVDQVLSIGRAALGEYYYWIKPVRLFTQGYSFGYLVLDKFLALLGVSVQDEALRCS